MDWGEALLDFVVPRRLAVSFSADPAHPLDPSPFDQAAFGDMRRNGVSLSKWALILDASIHYQGRYRTQPAARVVSALAELAPSLSRAWDGGFLCFGGNESNEFQTRSTEVIGVGLAIGIARRLLAARRNQVFVIEATGKRLDFWVETPLGRYAIEARGRKGDLQDAIQGVYDKKIVQQATMPHYGVVSHIPRDGSPATSLVVDPIHSPEPTPDYVRARLVLEHYARTAAIAGFWRLSQLLFHRADHIVSQATLEAVQDTRLDYGRVAKLGRSLSVSLGEAGTWDVFINADPSLGLRSSVDRHSMLLGLDRHLVELLEMQDLGDLFDYYERAHGDDPVETNQGYFLPRDDGTLGILLRPGAAI
ncbi:MAG: hypothetical protein HGA87_02915 [Desulfobulbaceae bacterium]|nr:hypothetical protein [Desulfobulbaceae bacterium]